MCTYFDKVVDGIDVFSVGKQQLWDWCSYNGREYTGWLPDHVSVHSYADSLRKGIYLVVELPATFGRVRKPQLIASCTSLKSAVSLARTYDNHRLQHLRSTLRVYGCVYEVWHVVDDGDLWQVWEHDAELSRVDVPVLLDERDVISYDDQIDTVQLWSLNVPCSGIVSFLWFLCRGELVEEFIISDWHCGQPKRLRYVGYYHWISVENMLDCINAYEMMRDAGSLDVGGRVGADF